MHINWEFQYSDVNELPTSNRQLYKQEKATLL